MKIISVMLIAAIASCGAFAETIGRYTYVTAEVVDAAAALGPESGHFGLSGMRERAKRSGMVVSWGTEGRWTAVNVEVKPL